MKVCIAGCSFSDYTHVDKVWGEYLTEKMNCEYIHEAAGCGSNYRIWRTVMGHILEGRLTSKDLLIVQYTSLDRREFWSANPVFKHVPEVKLKTQEPSYNGGSLIRYKYGAHVWQDYAEEKQLFELYERNFVNPRYEAECFNVYSTMFQHFLLAKNIKTIFMRVRAWYHNPKSYLDEFQPYFFDEPEEFSKDKTTWLTESDLGHLSAEGHKRFSDLVFNHIHSTGILNGIN